MDGILKMIMGLLSASSFFDDYCAIYVVINVEPRMCKQHFAIGTVTGTYGIVKSIPTP